jgi:catechol 2,3-dioxygenase
VAATGWPIEGASDHGVSEALYLSDPDGLGIEIYADRPRERWERAPDGSFRMFTLPLDVEDLLEQGLGDPQAQIAPGTRIGHVHLKVADVPRARAFYGRALGFEQQAALPSAAFLSAGGYHHHVGLNSWQSAGEAAAPDDAPGLRLVRFELSGPDAVADVERSVADDAGSPAPRRENGTVLVRDPDGQLLAFAQD